MIECLFRWLKKREGENSLCDLDGSIKVKREKFEKGEHGLN